RWWQSGGRCGRRDRHSRAAARPSGVGPRYVPVARKAGARPRLWPSGKGEDCRALLSGENGAADGAALSETAGADGSEERSCHGGGRVKLLLIGPYPPPHGGISVHVAEAKRQLDERGICCRVLNLDRRAPES